MPARRLDSQPVVIRRFDVCGQDSDSEPEFVRHVGLANEERSDARAGIGLPLVHMAPPLAHGADGAAIQAIGSADLSADEQEQIRVFVDELDLEYAAQNVRAWQQYVIHPHVREPDENTPCRQFNCAGFVIEAYREAGIDLLVSDARQLPGIDLLTLAHAYPDSADSLARPSLRAIFGLDGEGPWPVLLPGYILNALNRRAEEIRAEPYITRRGDEYFPSRSTP